MRESLVGHRFKSYRAAQTDFFQPMRELTEQQMADLGWAKVGALYVKQENGFICFAFALPNGNAPIGGDFYQVFPLAR